MTRVALIALIVMLTGVGSVRAQGTPIIETIELNNFTLRDGTTEILIENLSELGCTFIWIPYVPAESGGYIRWPFDCDGLDNARMRYRVTFPTNWNVTLNIIRSSNNGTGWCYGAQSWAEVTTDAGTQIVNCTGNDVAGSDLAPLGIAGVRSVTLRAVANANINMFALLFRISYTILPGINPGGGGGYAPGCVTLTVPSAGDPIALVEYGAGLVNNVLVCQIIPILQGIWQQIVDFMNLIQSWFSHCISEGNRIAQWTITNTTLTIRYQVAETENQFTRVVNAINSQIVTERYIEGGTEKNIWDVLVEFLRTIASIFGDIAGFGTTLINAIVSVISALTSVANAVISLISNIALIILVPAFDFAGLLTQIVTVFLAGFEGVEGATPVLNIANLPFDPMADAASATLFGQSCAADPWFGMCLGVYVLENTLLAETPGQLSVVNTIHLMVGVAIMLFFMRLGLKFKEAFQ